MDTEQIAIDELADHNLLHQVYGYMQAMDKKYTMYLSRQGIAIIILLVIVVFLWVRAL